MTSVRSNSGLGRWFREKWVDISRPKEGGGFEPCGRSDTSKGRYPKCVPAATAARMSPEEIKSAIRRKRRAESSRERDGKAPIMVSTFKDGRPTKRARTFKKNKPADPQLYAKVKAEARRRFDVYPSAYANGWLVQEYKRRGGKYLRASAAPASAVLTCTSTVVFACMSKACAPPPVGTGGSNPSGAGRASNVADAVKLSAEARSKIMESMQEKYGLRTTRDIMPEDEYEDYYAAVRLFEYVRDEYGPINEQLRGQPLRHPLSDRRDPKRNEATIRSMDHAFTRYSVELTEPVEVVRGISLRTGAKNPFVVGVEFTDKGFVSTTSDTKVADLFMWQNFGGNDLPILMRIKVPAGTRVLGGHSEESELILNRGSRFRVTSMRDGEVRHNRQSVIVEMELLP